MSAGALLSLAGYKLTFDDEFNSLKAGRPGTAGTVWETQNFYGVTSNGSGTQNPIPPGQPGSLLSVSNGVLDMHITSTQVPYLDTNPGGVPGGFSQQYGYFEMSAKFPPGNGYSSAFWMLPNSGPWPPEIDIEESQGQFPNLVEMTNHGGDTSTPAQFLDDWNAPNTQTGFHTYGLMWTPTTLTWYIDGVAMFSAQTAGNENVPMNVILSAYANQQQTFMPPVTPGSSSDFYVDWVHVYSNAATAQAIVGQASYQNHDGSTSGGLTAPPPTTDPPPPPPPIADPVLIKPGSGSFTDTAGNVYTLTTADIAMENGKAMAGGGGTGAMEYASNIVYGQDAASGTWYTWNQTQWSLASSPPPPVSAGGTVSPPPPPQIQFVYPGSGTITDAAGNKFTLSSSDAAMENGKAMNGGGGTSALELANSHLYGEDAGTGTWWQWSSTINDWQQATPPDTTRVIVPSLGSFKDSAGHTYSINSGDNVLRDGRRITSDGDTSAAKLVAGNVFRLNDQTNTWSEWSNSTHRWT